MALDGSGNAYVTGWTIAGAPAPSHVVNVTILTVSITDVVQDCNGLCNGSATAIANGTPPYIYLWSNGQTTSTAVGLCAGTYTVTVTDDIGCIATVPVTLTAPASPTASIVGTNPSCDGASDGSVNITVSGGTPPYVFAWLPGGETTEDLTNLMAGIYNVTITDDNGCTASTGATINNPGIPCVSNCNAYFWLKGSSIIRIPPCNQFNLWIATPCPTFDYGYIIYALNPPGGATWDIGTTIEITLDNMQFKNHFSSNCNFTTTALPGATTVIYTLNAPVVGNTWCTIKFITNNITIPGGGIWNPSGILNINCADGSTPTFTTSLQEGPDMCSCDPNDKQVSPSGCGELGFIVNQELTYTLTFQNLGTGPAHDIVLRDTIDDDLDLNTLQILTSSHSITNTNINLADRELVITFQGIELPAEMDDPDGSVGFVIYSITPNPGLPEGTIITNSTGIFFNGNVPVITNTVINTIVNDPVVTVDAGPDKTVFFGYDPEACVILTASATGALPPYSFGWSTGETTQNITVCPEETTDYTVIASASRCLSVEDTVTVNVVDVHCGNNNNKVLICHIPPGEPDSAHTICISQNAVAAHLTNHGDYIGPCVVDTTLPDSLNSQVQFSKVFLTSYPNPISQKTNITFNLTEPGNVTLEVYYLNSLNIVKLFEGYAEANVIYTVEFDVGIVANGIYFYRLITETGTYTKKLVVIKSFH